MTECIQPQGSQRKTADILEWYVRMSTDPPPVDSTVEMLIGQCKEEDATLEANMHMTDNQLSN